jgi:hypothetical protein
VLDTSLLFAMIIYGVVALLLRAGIDWATDFVAKRRRRLEREVCDDRLEALPASVSPAAFTPAATTHPGADTPASPADPPFSDAPR